MNKQLIVFYLKRHILGIVGLVLAIGFGAGGFILMGKAKEAVAQAEGDYNNKIELCFSDNQSLVLRKVICDHQYSSKTLL